MSAIRKAARLLPRVRGRIGRWLHPSTTLIDDSHELAWQPETLIFQCNVCSSRCAVRVSLLQRELGHCVVCDASMRYRSVIHHLSVGLFGTSLPIDEFPAEALSLSGIGMSDSDKYARVLATRLRYTNTYYHKEPRLDILSPRPEHRAAYDFVITSDVLEHVNPPVATAFANLRSLLKPGGLLVLTVPFGMEGDTVEHFPDLNEYTVEERAGSFVLINRTANGHMQEYSDLVFHGGPGSTLEMRLFSEAGLRRELEHAGFTQIAFHREPSFQCGVYWDAPWSVPITAIAA
jgi:SAM-dependent methyltransferase